VTSRRVVQPPALRSAGPPRLEEGVDGAEERVLVALGEPVDGLKVAQHVAADGGSIARRRLHAEDLIGGDPQGLGEPDGPVRVRPRLPPFVVWPRFARTGAAAPPPPRLCLCG